MPVLYGENLSKILDAANVPKYAVLDGTSVNTENTSKPSNYAGYYNQKEAPTTINWFDFDSNTLIHENEHLRQSAYGLGDTSSKTFEGKRIPIGSMGDTNFWDIRDKLDKIDEDELSTKYGFGLNYRQSRKELFANLTAYKVQQEAKGIEFSKTPLAKVLGVKKGSDLSGYIHEHTLVGQDKLYEIDKPPTMSERLLSFIHGKMDTAKQKLESIK